jgi:hypothetical protein
MMRLFRALSNTKGEWITINGRTKSPHMMTLQKKDKTVALQAFNIHSSYPKKTKEKHTHEQSAEDIA